MNFQDCSLAYGKEMVLMSANFTPDRTPMNDLKPFKFWCQKVLPAVYDDSLSYYELLCKVVDLLNQAIENDDAINTDMNNVITAYNQLQDYVNTYFENLDVEQEINDKLDAMALSGELGTIISPYVPNVVSGWLGEHLSPTEPPIDSSLTIKNAGADSEQTGFLARGSLNDKYNETYTRNIVNTNELKDGAYNLQTGSVSVVETWYYSETYYPAGRVVSNARPFIIFYDDNYEFISGVQLTANTPHTPPTGAKYIRYSINSLNTVISYGDTVKEGYKVNLNSIGINEFAADAINSWADNTGFEYSESNIINSETQAITGEYYKLTSGEIANSSDFSRCPTFFPVTGNKVISNGRPFFIFYDKEYEFISGTQPSAGNVAVDIPSNAKYLRFCVVSNDFNILAISFCNILENIPTEFKMDNLKARIEDGHYLMFNQLDIVETGNIFDSSLLENGYYDTTSGLLRFVETWMHDPTFYKIHGKKITVRNAFFLTYYDENFDFISGASVTANSTNTPPTNAVYFRYSVSYNSSTVYGIYLGNALKGGKKIVSVKNLSTEKYYTIVDKGGNGNYTSLTRALYETNDDLFVMPGTYNIVDEYKELFGNDIFSTIADNVDMRHFQYGLFVDNREVKFSPSARVLCYLQGVMTVDSTHRFSPFNLGSNAKISGLICAANNVFYLIHDDFGNVDECYTNVIEDCILTMNNPVNRNIIGGGVRLHSTNIVRGNYMNNGLDSTSETMRYHNYNSASANSKVIVYNNKVNGFIGARNYGSHATGILNFMAYNNETGSGVKKLNETPDSQNNVSLFAWNNTTV